MEWFCIYTLLVVYMKDNTEEKKYVVKRTVNAIGYFLVVWIKKVELLSIDDKHEM